MLLNRLFILFALSTAPLLNATEGMNSIAEQAVVEVLYGKESADQMEKLPELSPWKDETERVAALEILNTHFNENQLQQVMGVLSGDLSESSLEMDVANARSYLSAAKWVDLTFGEGELPKSTFEIRKMAAAILGDESVSLDCFSLTANPIMLDNNFTKVVNPNPSWTVVAQNSLVMVKERRDLQRQVFIDFFKAILGLSERMDNEQPTILIIRGNSGSGKTYWTMQHPFLSNALKESGPLSGVQNTDYFNYIVSERSKLSPNQNFFESVAMRKSLRDAIFKFAPTLSHVVDGYFNKYVDLELSVASASNNGGVVKIVDLDVPLELSCLRLLSREIQPGCPPFASVAKAFTDIRQVRHKLFHELLKIDALVAYQLIVTDHYGNTSVVVEKVDGKITITPGAEALFAEATRTDSQLDEINAVASRVITQADVDLFGVNLQRYVGMTIESAMTLYRDLSAK